MERNRSSAPQSSRDKQRGKGPEASEIPSPTKASLERREGRQFTHHGGQSFGRSSKLQTFCDCRSARLGVTDDVFRASVTIDDSDAARRTKAPNERNIGGIVRQRRKTQSA